MGRNENNLRVSSVSLNSKRQCNISNRIMEEADSAKDRVPVAAVQVTFKDVCPL